MFYYFLIKPYSNRVLRYLIKDLKDRFPLPDQVEDRFCGNDRREEGMTKVGVGMTKKRWE